MVAISGSLGGELDKQFFTAVPETEFEADYMSQVHSMKSKSNNHY